MSRMAQCILDIKHFECIYGFDGLQPRITCYFGGLLSLGVVLEKSPGGPLKISKINFFRAVTIVLICI